MALNRTTTMCDTHCVERRGGCGRVIFLLLLVGLGIYWGVNKYQAMQAEGNSDAWNEALAPVDSAGDRLQACLAGTVVRLGTCADTAEDLATAAAEFCDRENELGDEVPRLDSFVLQGRVDNVHSVCTSILQGDDGGHACSLVYFATKSLDLQSECLVTYARVRSQSR